MVSLQKFLEILMKNYRKSCFYRKILLTTNNLVINLLLDKLTTKLSIDKIYNKFTTKLFIVKIRH